MTYKFRLDFSFLKFVSRVFANVTDFERAECRAVINQTVRTGPKCIETNTKIKQSFGRSLPPGKILLNKTILKRYLSTRRVQTIQQDLDSKLAQSNFCKLV